VQPHTAGRILAARFAKWGFVFYLVALHLVVLVVLAKSNFIYLAEKTLGLRPPEERTLGLYAAEIDKLAIDRRVPGHSLVLLGDSIMAEVDPKRISEDTYNLAVGGLTARTLGEMAPAIRSIGGARGIVLGVGVNDLKYRDVAQIKSDYDRLLARFTSHARTIVLSVLPVLENGPAARARSYLNAGRINSLNQGIEELCKRHPDCTYLDTAAAMFGAAPEAHAANFGPDGWHLSQQGSDLLAGLIAAQAAELGAGEPRP
jgi:lysophospholipase L1-like esterase